MHKLKNQCTASVFLDWPLQVHLLHFAPIFIAAQSVKKEINKNGGLYLHLDGTQWVDMCGDLML